jgi:signal transduction histidine kinase/ligand-binding sensor domain-containing protein
LSIRNGLETGQVVSVYTDSRGFAWVSTLNGLYRYDGHKVKYYGTAQGLSDTYLQSTMLEDQAGNLWFCSYTKLFCYDPLLDKCLSFGYLYNDKEEKPLADYALIHLENGKYLWLTAGKKLFRVDLLKTKQSRKLLVITCDTHGKEIDGKRFLAQLDDTKQLKGFWEFYRIGYGFSKWEQSDHLSFTGKDYFNTSDTNSPVLEIYQILPVLHAKEQYWICTTQGLFKFQLNNPEQLDGPYAPAEYQGVRSLLYLHNNLILCSTASGLYYFDPKRLRFSEATNWSAEFKNLSFAKGDLADLSQDQNNNLWALAPGYGVAFTHPDLVKSKFISLTFNPLCIAATNENELLIGSQTDLHLCTKQGKQSTVLPEERVVEILPDADPAYSWIRSFTAIYKFDHRHKKIQKVITAPPNELFWGVYCLSNGKVLVSTNTKINFWNAAKNRLEPIPIEKKLVSCFNFFEDKLYERLYFQENSDVLRIYSYHHQAWREEKNISFKSEIGNILAPRSSAFIWLTTPKGIIQIERNTLEHKTMPLPANWPQGGMLNLVQDKQGVIWVSSNTHMLAFSAQGRPLGIFNYPEGLFAAPFQTRKLALLKDGNIAVAGNNGLSWFNPQQMLHKRPRPDLKITDFNVQGKPYHALYPSDSAVFLNRSIRICYRENSFDLRIVGIDMAWPAGVKIQYYLKGLEDPRRAAIYSQADEPRYEKIAPGHYTLRARAANGNGRWGAWESKLDITIVPPLWMRWWFIALEIALGIFLITLLVQVYYRRQLREIRIRNEEQERILRDIHDLTSGKVVFFKDFQTFAETEINNPEARNKALNIGEQALSLFKRISATVRNNIESDSTLLEFLQQLISESKKMVSPAMGFTAHLASSIPYAWVGGESKKHLRLVVQEALGNVLKHAQATQVHLSIELKDGKLYLSIQDNGQGISSERIAQIKPTDKVQESGNGLGNMLHRMHGIGGNIQWKNEQGTVVIISISVQKIKPKRKKILNFV